METDLTPELPLDPANAVPAMKLGLKLMRWLFAAAFVFVLLGGALLYRITRGDGKDVKASADPVSGPCQSAQILANHIAPLAHGEIAALTLAKTPRVLPDLTFNAADGTRTGLQAFRGKLVLLNLWATWCIPCRQEMPALDKLQGAEGGADFEVVAVNIDTARFDKPKAMLTEIGIKNLAYYADPAAEIFQNLRSFAKVQGLPATLLIDKQGCEIGMMAGPADWASPDALALIKAAKGG